MSLLPNLLYKEYSTYRVLAGEVNIITDIVGETRNTIAEIDNKYHYMGEEYDTISTAIFAWQEVNNKMLSTQELRQVMIDNGIIEGDNNASQEDYQEITDEDIIQEDD